jgi:hypothetical protein
VELLWILVRSSSHITPYNEQEGLMIGMELILGSLRLLLGSVGMWVSLLVSRDV